MMDDNEEFNGAVLLRDIEEINKALYLNMSQPVAFNASCDSIRHVSAVSGTFASKPKVILRDSPQKDKKSSIWKWRPLKALSHMRSHRFNCHFFLHVHGIEGLPFSFNNFNLCVTWKRKNETLRTRPAPVYDRMAEFEETLAHRCTIYASANGNQNLVDYEPKLFLLRTFVIGAPSVNIGKHWIDLTRLLPLTLQDLEGEQRRSGKWTTSFKLNGKAEGAMLNVSFGFSISDGNPFKPGYFVKIPDDLGEGWKLRLDRDVGPVAEDSMAKLNHLSHLGMKSLDEIFSNQESGLGQSISLLYQKLDEGNVGPFMELGFSNRALASLKSMSRSSPRSPGESSRYDDVDIEYTVIEQGVEVSTKDHMGIQHQDSVRSDSYLNETLDAFEIFKEDKTDSDEKSEWFSELDTFYLVKNERSADDIIDVNDARSLKQPMVAKLDLYDDSFISKPLEFDLLLDIEKQHYRKNYTASSSSYYQPSKLKRSLSLVDNAESIEDDFLKMLSISESPANTVSDGDREFPVNYPIKQFEEDTSSLGKPFPDSGSIIAQPINSCCLAPSGFARLDFEDDTELDLGIEEVEKHNLHLTQTLLTRSNAKKLENMETESLMHEWGLNEDAFLNSQHSCSGGFGSPIYIPVEEPLKLPSLGKGLGTIIQTRTDGFLRSMNPLLFRNSQNGARLIVQFSAPFVLPLSMGSNAIEVLQHWASLGVEKMSAQVKDTMPLEDITEKTIQDMVSATKSKQAPSERWELQHERETEQVPQAGENASEHFQFSRRSSYYWNTYSGLEDVESEYVSLENLIPMAMRDIEVLLMEGLKIQSGFQDHEAPSSTNCDSVSTGKRAEPLQLIDVSELVEYAIPFDEWIRLTFDPMVEGDEHSLKTFAADEAKLVEREDGGGVEGSSSHFTIALKVQLRNPLRNYEMVGPFMLALVEVEERVVSPEKIQLVEERFVLNEKPPRFKVLKANLAGLSGSHHQLWGTVRQQQSGYRWLLSSGLAVKNKHSNSHSRASVLWSISPQTQRAAAAWNNLVALNVHVRNPDIVFPGES